MTTTWKVAQLKRTPTTGLVIDVTYIMNFNLEGESDRKVGSVTLEGDPTDPNFIPFENLTEEVVLDWVKAAIGEVEVTAIEAQYEQILQEKIDKKNNPEFLVGTPWNS
jgi:hypothetical protein